MAKLVRVLCLLAIVVVCDWRSYQLDVNNAFLHDDLDEEVYLKILQEFSKLGEHRVCRLINLYMVSSKLPTISLLNSLQLFLMLVSYNRRLLILCSNADSF